MNFTIQIMGQRHDGTEFHLTHGIDATLNIDLGIAWYWKRYFHQPGSIYRGVDSPLLTLSGKGVWKTAQGDLIIRKRAVNGTTMFEDARVLEEFQGVKLNFTMTKPYFDWRRVDDDYADTLQLVQIPNTRFQTLPMTANLTNSELVTNPFNVIGECLVYCSKPTDRPYQLSVYKQTNRLHLT
jgi:hypothetical protein